MGMTDLCNRSFRNSVWRLDRAIARQGRQERSISRGEPISYRALQFGAGRAGEPA